MKKLNKNRKKTDKNTIEGQAETFNEKKLRSVEVSYSFARLAEKYEDRKIYFEKRSERVYTCGSYLEFNKYKNGVIKLTKANFCKNRLCPMCSWRKSLKIFGQTQQIINYILKSKKYRFIFLTLTLKNVYADELKETIDLMFSAFKKMLRFKEMDIIKGYFKALEVTFNKKDNSYHPHIHLLLMVPTNYFNKENYMTQDDYSLFWKKALGTDYKPIVNIKAVRGTSKAVAEVAKYPVKDTDYIIKGDIDLTDEVVKVLDENLKGRQLAVYGREMLKAKKELKLSDIEKSDLIDTDNISDVGDELIQIIKLNWKVGLGNYEIEIREIKE